MQIKLYSNDCPKCIQLERKIKDKNITFQINKLTMEESIEFGKLHNISSMPICEINGEMLNFTQSIMKLNKI